MSTYILFHHPCVDGMTAALAAYLALGDEATYLPVVNGGERQAIPDGSTVYFLDAAWPRAALLELATRCSVIVIDHHKSTMDELRDLPQLWGDYVMRGIENAPIDGARARFDMSKSGCVLAWEYFHPGQPLPHMFALIQDRDLWRFALEDSRAFGAYMQTQELGLLTARAIYQTLYGPGQDGAHWLAHILGHGQTMLNQQDGMVARICKDAAMIEILGHRVPCVTTPVFQSEVGEELLRRFPDAPFASSWFQRGTQQVWSLRTRATGLDVSVIASLMGGGGHPGAAGFTLERPITVAPGEDPLLVLRLAFEGAIVGYEEEYNRKPTADDLRGIIDDQLLIARRALAIANQAAVV